MDLAQIPTERLREVAEAFRRIEHGSESSAIAAACIEVIVEGRARGVFSEALYRVSINRGGRFAWSDGMDAVLRKLVGNGEGDDGR